MICHRQVRPAGSHAEFLVINKIIYRASVLWTYRVPQNGELNDNDYILSKLKWKQQISKKSTRGGSPCPFLHKDLISCQTLVLSRTKNFSERYFKQPQTEHLKIGNVSQTNKHKRLTFNLRRIVTCFIDFRCSVMVHPIFFVVVH